MMPVQNEYDELLYAYALGCLDRHERDKLTGYINSGGEYSARELGELQNLAALFPSILGMEIPSPQLKDKVARKLYRVKDGKPGKKNGEKTVTQKPNEQEIEKEKQPEKTVSDAPAAAGQNNLNAEQEIEEEFLQEEQDLKLEDEKIDREEPQYQTIQEFEVVTARTKEEEPEPPDEEEKSPVIGTIKNRIEDFEINLDENQEENIAEPEIEKRNGEENINKKNEPPKVTLKERQPYSTFRKREIPDKKGSKAGIIIAAVLFIIFAAGLIFVYLKISSDVTVYRNSVDQLDHRINSLSLQVNNNRNLQKLLLTKNVKIVNLTAVKNGAPGYGKLIISFENSKGYLQLSNVPALSNGSFYVLWVIINNKYTSLGSFKVSDISSGKVEYFPFQLPELSNNGETKFLVSEETEEAPQKPSREIILTGTLQ